MPSQTSTCNRRASTFRDAVISDARPAYYAFPPRCFTVGAGVGDDLLAVVDPEFGQGRSQNARQGEPLDGYVFCVYCAGLGFD
jgi:hypothetical protein